ncbi:hypothetical protein V1505DRAFT_359258 [Lipomyces doorenjongii]
MFTYYNSEHWHLERSTSLTEDELAERQIQDPRIKPVRRSNNNDVEALPFTLRRDHDANTRRDRSHDEPSPRGRTSTRGRALEGRGGRTSRRENELRMLLEATLQKHQEETRSLYREFQDKFSRLEAQSQYFSSPYSTQTSSPWPSSTPSPFVPSTPSIVPSTPSIVPSTPSIVPSTPSIVPSTPSTPAPPANLQLRTACMALHTGE